MLSYVPTDIQETWFFDNPEGVDSQPFPITGFLSEGLQHVYAQLLVYVLM